LRGPVPVVALELFADFFCSAFEGCAVDEDEVALAEGVATAAFFFFLGGPFVGAGLELLPVFEEDAAGDFLLGSLRFFVFFFPASLGFLSAESLTNCSRFSRRFKHNFVDDVVQFWHCPQTGTCKIKGLILDSRLTYFATREAPVRDSVLALPPAFNVMLL